MENNMNREIVSLDIKYNDGSTETIPATTLNLLQQHLNDYSSLNDMLMAMLCSYDKDTAISELKEQHQVEINTKVAEEQKKAQDNKAIQRAVNVGFLMEKFLPFFPEYTYNPYDIRYVGHSFDFIVLNGLEETKQIQSIIFQEIKTGMRPKVLSPNEKALRNFIYSLNDETRDKIIYEQWMKKETDNVFSVISSKKGVC
jgi:predicted Holliday junction resolvase-like endonuclease